MQNLRFTGAVFALGSQASKLVPPWPSPPRRRRRERPTGACPCGRQLHIAALRLWESPDRRAPLPAHSCRRRPPGIRALRQSSRSTVRLPGSAPRRGSQDRPIRRGMPTYQSKKVRILPSIWPAHPRHSGRQLALPPDDPLPLLKVCPSRSRTGGAVERSLPPAGVNRGPQLLHSVPQLLDAWGCRLWRCNWTATRKSQRNGLGGPRGVDKNATDRTLLRAKWY